MFEISWDHVCQICMLHADVYLGFWGCGFVSEQVCVSLQRRICMLSWEPVLLTLFNSSDTDTSSWLYR